MSINPLAALTTIEQDWAAAKTAALTENKLILVDFYTIWCGPCKVFDRQVANHPYFANGIAENYVLLKYNAETDTEFLAQKHHVSSYPTYVLMTPIGHTITKQYGRFGGESSVDNFLDFLAEGVRLHQAGQYLLGVSTQIDLGYPSFYTDYINRVKFDWNEALAEFWASERDWTDELSFIILTYAGANETVYSYFLEHIDVYRERYGELDTEDVIEEVFDARLEAAIAARDTLAFAATASELLAWLPERGTEMILFQSLDLYQTMESWPRFIEAMDQIVMADAGEDYLPYFLNTITWELQEKCTVQEVLLHALQWMDPVITAEPNFAFLDTYAWLLYKAKLPHAAQLYATQAVSIGKAEGEDTTSSKELLQLLKE